MAAAQTIVDGMPDTLWNTVDSVLGPFCSQLASSQGLPPSTACPEDPMTGEPMTDCLLFSVQTEGEPVDIGSMCRSWCRTSQNCDQYLLSGCSNAQAGATPSNPIPAGDCKCISRSADPNYVALYNTGREIPADPKCWYFPCTAAPYLITAAEESITCPSFDYCEIINSIVAGAGSTISNNWFNSYVNCANSPDASPSGSPATTPQTILGLNWWQLTLVAGLVLLGLILLGSVVRKRNAPSNS
jgi:hypothetical protein